MGSSSAPFIKRVECWNDTVRTAARLQTTGLYFTPPSIKVTYDPSRWSDKPPPGGYHPAIDIAISNMDSIDCGLTLARQGLVRPLVLNLADEAVPGGLVAMGSDAQEESLFRRTTLCSTLVYDHRLYPIRPDEGIYSPDAWVIKASEQERWTPIDPPVRLSFMSVPGLRHPHVTDDENNPRLSPEDARAFEVKVRLMLQIAIDGSHDAVVLGASGCGAWKSPPRHVGEIFKRVLTSPEFAAINGDTGVIKVVRFAILIPTGDTVRRRGKTNHEEFTHVFKQCITQVHN